MITEEDKKRIAKSQDEYIESKELVLMSYPPEYIDSVIEDIRIAYMAGAKRMAELGSSIECSVFCLAGPHLYYTIEQEQKLLTEEFESGGEVVLQLRKK